MKKSRKFKFTMPMPYELNPKVMAGELYIEGQAYAKDDYDIDVIELNGMNVADILMNTKIFDPVFEEISEAAAQHVADIYAESPDLYDEYAQAV